METNVEQTPNATETREAYEAPVAQKVGRIDDIVELGNASNLDGNGYSS